MRVQVALQSDQSLCLVGTVSTDHVCIPYATNRQLHCMRHGLRERGRERERDRELSVCCVGPLFWFPSPMSFLEPEESAVQ